MSTRAFLAFLAVLAVVGLLGFGLLSKGEAKIAVGEPVPDRELPVLGGSGERSLADYRGEWVLVNLWASWCTPCRAEAPELERFARRFADRSGAFGSTGVPENFLVDPEGRLALIWRGPVDERFLRERVIPIVERRP